MRWILVLCLLVSGCLRDAEARGPGSRHGVRRSQSRVSGSGPSDAGFPDSGAGVIDRYSWSWSFAGSGCPETYGQGYPIQVGGEDAGAVTWGYGSDAGSYTCNGSTSWDGGSLSTAGLGTNYVNEAYSANNTNANCWGVIPPAVTFPAFADNADLWCRVILRTGNNALNTYLWSQGTSGTNVLNLYMSSTERMSFTLRTSAGAGLASASQGLSQESYSVVDFYYHGANPTNPSVDSYGNGTASVGSEHSVDLIGQSAGLNIGIGGLGYQTCSVSATTGIYDLVFIGCAYGALAAQFTGEAMHDADCQALGICP